MEMQLFQILKKKKNEILLSISENKSKLWRVPDSEFVLIYFN